MNRALSRAAGATSTARQAAAPTTPRLASGAVTPLSMRSNLQPNRRRLGDALIVRNELNKWCVTAIAGLSGFSERRTPRYRLDHSDE